MSGELPEQQAKGIPLTRQHNEVNDSGLVICAKNARPPHEENAFVSLEDVENALLLFPVESQSSLFDLNSKYFLAGSPGSIRIKKHDPKAQGQKHENWQARQNVVGWSSKSRSRMVERLATLDYSPFEIPQTVIAFLTLTYPGDWLAVAPSAKAAKTHLRALQKRFERAFGRPFFAVWKMEFQRRGAPHFHLLAPIPIGVEFSRWLSNAWTEIVNHPDPEERSKHLLAGTGTDIAKGISADNAQRISYYFSKHSSANVGPKEYQNTPPEEWVQSGTVGRFWGYWGLFPAVATVQLSRENALYVSRVLRRWQRANRSIRSVKVWRVSLRTGVVRARKANRRQKYPRSIQAFRIMPDAIKVLELLGAYLARLSSKSFD